MPREDTTEGCCLQQPPDALTPPAFFDSLLLPMVALRKVKHADFAREFCAAQARMHLKNTEVAVMLGVSLETVRKWRRGEAMADPKKMKKLATLFGLSPAQLQYGDVRHDNAVLGTMTLPIVQVSPEEQVLIHAYRQLPEPARKALREQVKQLVENFAKPSSANPFGRGTQ